MPGDRYKAPDHVYQVARALERLRAAGKVIEIAADDEHDDPRYVLSQELTPGARWEHVLTDRLNVPAKIHVYLHGFHRETGEKTAVTVTWTRNGFDRSRNDMFHAYMEPVDDRAAPEHGIVLRIRSDLRERYSISTVST